MRPNKAETAVLCCSLDICLQLLKYGGKYTLPKEQENKSKTEYKFDILSDLFFNSTPLSISTIVQLREQGAERRKVSLTQTRISSYFQTKNM